LSDRHRRRAGSGGREGEIQRQRQRARSGACDPLMSRAAIPLRIAAAHRQASALTLAAGGCPLRIAATTVTTDYDYGYGYWLLLTTTTTKLLLSTKY